MYVNISLTTEENNILHYNIHYNRSIVNIVYLYNTLDIPVGWRQEICVSYWYILIFIAQQNAGTCTLYQGYTVCVVKLPCLKEIM